MIGVPPHRRVDAAAVSVFPLFSYGFLMLFAWLSYRQEGHWQRFVQPDPSYVGLFSPGDGIGHLMLIFVGWIAVPGSIVATTFTLVHVTKILAQARWHPSAQVSAWLGARLFICLAGMVVFWSQLFTLQDWLLD